MIGQAIFLVATEIIIHEINPPHLMLFSFQCHSNERLAVVRGKIASCARVPLEQIQSLTFGDGTMAGIQITMGEQDNRLLHTLGIVSSAHVSVKISSSCAQLKEVTYVCVCVCVIWYN